MNQTLFEYIRHLSKTDTKSISDKTLKTQEEVGELARVVLPYVNAFATTHRFVEKERILEESVDIILCALSVAYDLDFTDDEIESMMKRKSEKWAKLQKAEANLKYPLPFEIHVTITPDGRSEWSVEYFRDMCAKIGVKPIMLDLQNTDGRITKDVMTSSTHFGTNTSAYNESQRIAHEVLCHAFEVARVKIETVPWHPASPKSFDDIMPKDCYFEAHIPIVHTPENKRHLEHFIALQEMPVHMSSNAFKKHADGTVTTMLTYRIYEGVMEGFDRIVTHLVDKLSDPNIGLDGYDWAVGKPHKEFSIYDTKVSHDAQWLLGDTK